MSGAGLLLALTPALPLALVGIWLAPALRARLPALLPFAPLPGLLSALFAPGGSLVLAPDPLRMVLTLDGPGALLLGGAAGLWSLAGFYAGTYLREDPRAVRFSVWWLLTLAGSLGLFIVADLASFYLMFALASLSAFGLVLHEGTPRARRAATVYMALAILGEAFLLLAFVLLAIGHQGNPLIADAVAALPANPHMDAILALLLLGFGLKMGLAPLHVWMPLAHPVAPMPASAALSGIIVKAGVIGLIRFLPLGAMLADWGGVLMAVGLATAFYGVAIGVTQTHPKTVLAYSTVSQMGFVAAVLGAGLGVGDAATATLAAFYALHHLLVKGALFLGVGVVAATGAARRNVPFVVMSVLALSLAGLPLTSGALAKFATKPLFGYGIVGDLATLTAVGSALLMTHFLRLLSQAGATEPTSRAARGLVVPWGLAAGASALVPWALFVPVSGFSLLAPLAPAAIWASSWPVLLGVAFASLFAGRLDRLPKLPEGDVIVLAERAVPLAARGGAAAASFEELLRRWPVAVTLLVALALALGGAFAAGG